MAKYLQVLMPDGSEWAVPVDFIAEHRARHYAHEYGGDVARSLAEDTMPLFNSDRYEIHDWAANNMNWEDVSHVAQQVISMQPVDYQEGWVNGPKRITER